MQESNFINRPLTQEEAIALALEDEFKAFETYKAIALRFQAEIPFGRIVESEVRHIEALIRAANRLGVVVPENRWAGVVVPPATLQEAYALGVQAEIENIALYDQLLPFVQDPEVRDIFYRLQAASYNNHLPAFQAHLHASQAQASYATQDPLSGIFSGLFGSEKQAGEKVREMSDFMQRFSQGQASPDELTKLLQGVNLSFLGGLLLGGAGVVLFKEWLEKNQNLKEKE